MSYTNLIIFLTNRCRSGCRTCNVRAIPGNSGMLQMNDIDTIFDDPHISGSNNKFVIWTGGEPFENFPVLEYGIKISGKRGFRSEILSSGYWYRDAPEMLDELFKKGDFSLRVSIDSEHFDFSGEEFLFDLLEECLEIGLELNFTVREIPGDQSFEGILNSIKKNFSSYTEERKGDPRWIHHIPHVPVDENDHYKASGFSLKINTGCKLVFRDIVAGWDGNIYPCCGLFSLPGFEKYSTGKIGKSGQTEVSNIKAEELFRIIKEKGPSGIKQKFDSDETKEVLLGFRNKCHACIHFLKKYDVQLEQFLSG